MDKKYYEVSISVEQVFTYKVIAENELEAEKNAIKKLNKEEEYEVILDSSGGIDEITEEEYYD